MSHPFEGGSLGLAPSKERTLRPGSAIYDRGVGITELYISPNLFFLSPRHLCIRRRTIMTRGVTRFRDVDAVDG